METKMILQNDLLWNRLQNFSLDTPNVDFPFSKKLAKEESWSLDFTKKAIEEYKRFVYLCCTLPNGASPSETVDKVWHMHLIYTQNYWEEFCPNVLRQKLHHHPSKGGSDDTRKHKIWFSDTLENYQKIFQHEPPEDIWSERKIKLKTKNSKLNILKIFSVASVLLILSSCSDKIGNFLTIIFIVIPAIFLFTSFLSGIFNKNNNPKSKNRNDNGDGNCFSSNSGSDSSSSCSSSCGSSCGGGCGGCGGGD